MPRRILLICGLCLLPACGGNDHGAADENADASTADEMASVQTRAPAAHPFDGVWVWQEGGPLYEIVIAESQVTSMRELSRNAPAIDYDKASVDICPVDGLCSIQFIRSDGPDEQEVFMFTFTESSERWWGYRGRTPHASGHFVIETRDMDLPLPRERMTAGQFRRRQRL